ncbi:beta-1,4-galactosyltransferase 7-like [Anneissia japonica]|uniref:beta-1,4-galactosyltransferase 7-like n=1 Tax=Anneissia japonica TaxID=1529436 RepID=UPI00142599F8|nr:beta-1,4-galactosyltransferase 7-like [Anneissia japonica]
MAKARRLSITRVLVVAIFLTFLASMVLMITYNNCDCESTEEIERKLQNIKCNKAKDIEKSKDGTIDQADKKDEDDMSKWDPHVLAIIVPFRERFEELLQFVPYMHKFLNMQKIRHEFYIVNQVDSYRFNRASLLNIGFMQAKKKCQYLAMHDVDLLPRNEKLSYRFDVVQKGPHHLSSYELHPRYGYKTFVGGILMLQMKHYELLNGMSNKFWGWGREDDEFYMRMKDADLEISRPQGITTGRDSFYHLHDKVRRPRDMTRSQGQKKDSFKRDRVTGLDTLQYELIRTHELKIEGAVCTIYHVKVACDEELTPWCVPTEKR